jgi:transcriptional regulator with XRE-family HTH domain
MKLRFTDEWLREKIMSVPDVEAEAGQPLESPALLKEMETGKVAVIAARNVVQMRIALGTFVHQLRQKQQLTLQQLAERADVSEDELRQVETNPSYTARPRLIYQLSQFFGVSLNNLSQMAGTHVVDRQLYNSAVKYAAHSDDLAPLTQSQLELLNGFIAVVNDASEKHCP